MQPFLYSSKCASFKTKVATEDTSCQHADTNLEPLIPDEEKSFGGALDLDFRNC